MSRVMPAHTQNVDRADDSRQPEGSQRRFVMVITRFEKPEPFSFPSIFADACDIVPV